jgi:NAD(P)-dependent dehydrogenase (short-subunit alcohol dehydrogenase family)
VVADTGDDASVKAMVANVLAMFSRIDVPVNCAATAGGQSKPPALTEITNEQFFTDMNVKVMGYLRTAREVAGQRVEVNIVAAREFPAGISGPRRRAFVAF